MKTIRLLHARHPLQEVAANIQTIARFSHDSRDQINRFDRFPAMQHFATKCNTFSPCREYI
jgi:hypothetical protein